MIDAVFDRMDGWRHLPNYQLERRADVFFSLYLAEALEAKLCFPICPDFIPEFPIRIGTIDLSRAIDRSYKIDYLGLSADHTRAIFVELKAERLSRRLEQDEYLLAAQRTGLRGLIEGLLEIFRASKSKRKYFYLLRQLQVMGLLRIPDRLDEIMLRNSLVGATQASMQIEIVETPVDSLVVYVQPNASGEDVISFAEFAAVVQRHNDPLSRRFARSRLDWSSVHAGQTTSSWSVVSSG